LDTGFDGGLKLPKAYSDFLKTQGITGWDRIVDTAGQQELAKLFRVDILEVSGIGIHKLATPIQSSLFCFQGQPHLMGLDILKKWVSEFNGPKKHLRLLSEFAPSSAAP